MTRVCLYNVKMMACVWQTMPEALCAGKPVTDEFTGCIVLCSFREYCLVEHKTFQLTVSGSVLPIH